jgi:hypothetical protein
MTPEVSHRFDDPAVIEFTNSVLHNWIPSDKPILFVPCSKSKPIQESRSHKQMFHRFKARCQILILSEPLTIIPYDRYDYPQYEYPPSALWRIPGESDIFKERLIQFLLHHDLNNSECYFLTPHHHLMILWPAWKAAFGDVHNLFGFAYSQATRWFFIDKLEQMLGVNGL